MLVEHINNVNMIKKRGRNIIIRRGTIKVSFFDTSLFNDKVYDEDITRVIVKSDPVAADVLSCPSRRMFSVAADLKSDAKYYKDLQS